MKAANALLAGWYCDGPVLIDSGAVVNSIDVVGRDGGSFRRSVVVVVLWVGRVKVCRNSELSYYTAVKVFRCSYVSLRHEDGLIIIKVVDIGA